MDRRMFIRLGSLAAGALAGGSLGRVLAQSAKGAPGATVNTSAGKVRGLVQNGVQSFKGVPFAASTAGAARFLPPAKREPWTGVRDSFDFGLRCPQLASQFHGQVPPEFDVMCPDEPTGEDCLCLNIWTAGTSASRKRPVMVWLHGGGYTTGSGAFTCCDGTALARKHDVVVVTINHRVNVFGFLYLAEIGGEQFAKASNVGMLDIVAALAWIRDNIAAFGGDPGCVTIFGQSGGAGKVSTLMAMPEAVGLFQRAIVQSGAEVRGIPSAAATKGAEAYLGKLGLKTNQLDGLQKLPTEQLLSVMGEMTGSGIPGAGTLPLGPVVDGRTLPANPFDPVASDLSANVPLLIGTTETEVSFFPNQQLDPIDDANLHARVKQILRGADDAKVDQLIAAYRKGRPNATNTDLFLIIASDATFRTGVVLEAERKAAQGKALVYQYLFAWRSPVRDGKLRSFHTLEIPFVFDSVDLAKSMTGSAQDAYVLAEKVSSAWVAFARTGNPNHAGFPQWAPFDNSRRAVMILEIECKAVNDPYGAEQRLLHLIQTAT